MNPTIETLERIAERYRDGIEEFDGRAKESHFNHLIGTLCTTLNLTPQFLSRDLSIWEDEKTIYRKTIRALRTYLNLLRQFPEFREGELGSDNRYFPDVSSNHDADLKALGWMSGSHYYIHEANKRLRRVRK